MRSLLLSLCLFAGLGCAVFSAFTPWFEVPTYAASLSGSASPIVTTDSRCEVVFQVITVIAACLSIGFSFRRPQGRSVATAIAAGGLAVLFFFPHVQQSWQPRLTAQASWLQIQHENLTWFGGDIFRGQELEGSPAQMQMYLSDSPRHVTVMNLPTWSLHSFGLHQLPSLLEWLGYTNTFCQFVARGWLLAVTGLSCVLLAMIFQQQAICVANVRTAIHTLLVCGVVGVCCVWQAPVRASLRLQQAADATHRGFHSESLEHLRNAAAIWPPLNEDTWFVAQVGLSQHLVGINSLNSELHLARALEIGRQFDRAANSFRELATAEDANPAIRREASRGILRQAIRALNSGERTKAIEGFELVLDVEPCNIKALYALQLAYLQRGEQPQAKRVHAQLAGTYEHLNFPNKKIVIAKSRTMVMQPQMFQRNRGEMSHITSRD